MCNLQLAGTCFSMASSSRGGCDLNSHGHRPLILQFWQCPYAHSLCQTVPWGATKSGANLL